MKEEIKYLKTLTKGAEDRGVTLALNPHTGGSIYNTATVLTLLDEIDSPVSPVPQPKSSTLAPGASRAESADRNLAKRPRIEPLVVNLLSQELARRSKYRAASVVVFMAGPGVR